MSAATPEEIAFLLVVRDVVQRLSPRERPLVAVVIEQGKRPRLMLRSDFARHLRDADLVAEARKVGARVRPHEVLVWFDSSEGTGACVIAVTRPPGTRGDVQCALPSTAVIRALMGDEVAS